MCVGVPGEIVAIEGSVATISFWGEQKTVMLDLLESPPSVGQWVLAHLGFAVRVIPDEDVAPMLELYASMLGDADGAPGDAQGSDDPIRGA
ncbi:HypC/HybG/HupF family hydrogenase formation chaperone [Myxococcota bacterium]|nr:HypC/HybG/HupF family hydrogenase formation chaperone [Myxococcota bacterium]